MKKNCANLILAVSSLLILSCQKASSKDDLKDAQLCLNTSAAVDARACLSKIASDTSLTANKLRCAAVFIAEGVTAVTLADSLDKLKTPGTCTGGCSATVTAINGLNFHNGVNLSSDAVARQRNIDVAAEAFTYCSASGSSLYTQISSLFRIGTLASMAAYPLTGGAQPTEDQIKTAIASLDNATLGSIVTSTYSTSCQNLSTASDATKAYCTELSGAINGGSSPTAIGNCLKIKLQNPSAACP